VKISLRQPIVVTACLVAFVALSAAPGSMTLAASLGAPSVGVPPIVSANGATSSATTSGASWHSAHADSGSGHNTSQAVHFFLPRTSTLVVPAGATSRAATQHAAPGAGLDNTGGAAAPPSLDVQPPASGAHTRDITIGTNFNGSGYTGWIPPDGGMASGPHQVIVAINGAFNVFSKGGAALSSQTLGGFFAGLPDASTAFDPHVEFDPNSQRFWVVAAATNGTTSSELFVGVSNDSDAMHGWSTYWLGVQGNFPNDWCDYPEIGLSSAGYVYMTCNMFSLKNAGGTATSMIRVMPESEFTGGSCCSWWEYWNLAGWSIQPTVMRNSGTGNGEFLASAGNGSADSTVRQYRVYNETVCCGSGPTLIEADIGVGSYSAPPCAVQPDSSYQCLESGNDARLVGAVWQYPYLYTWMDTSSGGYAKPYFIQISDLDNSVTQSWVLNYGSYSSMYPEVGVRPNGDMSMVTDEVSPSTANNLYASSWVIGIPNQGVCTVCTDGPAHWVASGAGNYQRLDTESRNRWGDYSGAFEDPDGTGIWVMGQYATNVNTYGMQVELTRESGDSIAPSSSASLSPPANANGWNRANTTVNINASDGGSGVYYQTFFATGAGAFGTSTGGASVSPVISAEGTTTVYFQATDNWSNTNAYQQATVRIDKTLPSTTSVKYKRLSPTSIRIKGVASDPGCGTTGSCVQAIYYYYNTAGDGSTSGVWNLIGQSAGTSGSVVWNTVGVPPGSHRIAADPLDYAGNIRICSAPGDNTCPNTTAVRRLTVSNTKTSAGVLGSVQTSPALTPNPCTKKSCAYVSIVHGATITFTETPKSGHHFVRWLVNGVAKGNATSLSVTITGNTKVAAVYK
jgi:hypothetical protein